MGKRIPNPDIAFTRGGKVYDSDGVQVPKTVEVQPDPNQLSLGLDTSSSGSSSDQESTPKKK